MGLPSYLKEKYWDNGVDHAGPDCPAAVPFGIALGMGVIMGRSPHIREGIPRDVRVGKEEHVSRCLRKFALKHHFFGIYEGEMIGFLKSANLKTSDLTERHMYEKIPVMIFRYHEKENGKWSAYGFKYMCNRYYARTIETWTAKKQDADMKLLLAKEELDRMRNTEQGRTFKGRLRQIIMERDGYKCVLCGKSAEDGVKLEVDHVKAWEDGGRTIYDNGRTVCSDCNKGLHWAKKFKEKLEEVQEVTA